YDVRDAMAQRRQCSSELFHDDDYNVVTVQCAAECKLEPPSCEYRKFSVDVQTVRYQKAIPQFSVQLRLQSFVIPVFEEKLAMDSESFLAQFGGCISL